MKVITYLLIHLGSDFFDEVGNWLRRYGFFKYNDLCKTKNILQLKELSQKLSRADIRKVSSLQFYYSMM